MSETGGEVNVSPPEVPPSNEPSLTPEGKLTPEQQVQAERVAQLVHQDAVEIFAQALQNDPKLQKDVEEIVATVGQLSGRLSGLREQWDKSALFGKLKLTPGVVTTGIGIAFGKAAYETIQRDVLKKFGTGQTGEVPPPPTTKD